MDSRSQFLETALARFGKKIAHLEQEALDIAVRIRPPLVDTAEARTAVADNLNKVYVESLDNSALGSLLSERGIDPKSLGGLKRLQLLMENESGQAGIGDVMAPLFALYDLRVAFSHLQPAADRDDRLRLAGVRLGFAAGASLLEIYDKLLVALTKSFKALAQSLPPRAA